MKKKQSKKKLEESVVKRTPFCPFPKWNTQYVENLIEEQVALLEKSQANLSTHEIIIDNQQLKSRTKEWRSPSNNSFLVRPLISNNPYLMDIDHSKLTEEELQQFKESYERYCEVLPLTDFKHGESWLNAFNSALAMIAKHYKCIPIGSYLWERIWPKNKERPYLPQLTNIGKYYVKLYFMGAERMIEIDDLLPHDENGHILFPQTEKRELWPAYLMKALLKLAQG